MKKLTFKVKYLDEVHADRKRQRRDFNLGYLTFHSLMFLITPLFCFLLHLAAEHKFSMTTDYFWNSSLKGKKEKPLQYTKAHQA